MQGALTYRPHVPSLSHRVVAPGITRPTDANRRPLHAVLVAVAVAATGLATLVVAASPAWAHGSQLRTNDVATVGGVTPPTAGLEVLVRATGLVNVRYSGGGEVVVVGYEGEPYLRLDGQKVFENRHSPSTYINRSLTGNPDVPADASATASPEWVQIGTDGWARFHDHQLHRMGPAPGPLDWKVDLLVDGKPVAVSGQLVPLARPSRLPWLGLGALVALALAIAWVRLVRHRRAIMLVALGLSFFAAQIVAVGVGGTLAWVATLASLVAFVVTIRADEAWSAGMAGLLVAVTGWFQLADVGYAALFMTVPGGLYRAAVVSCVALGVVLAVCSLDLTRRGGFRRAVRVTP